MPELPSGRYVTVRFTPFFELCDRAVTGTNTDHLMRIRRREDIYPYVEVMEFPAEAPSRPAWSDSEGPLPDPRRLDQVVQDSHNWSAEDREAFETWIDDAVLMRLLDSLMDDLRNLQRKLLMTAENRLQRELEEARSANGDCARIRALADGLQGEPSLRGAFMAMLYETGLHPAVERASA